MCAFQAPMRGPRPFGPPGPGRPIIPRMLGPADVGPPRPRFTIPPTLVDPQGLLPIFKCWLMFNIVQLKVP